MFGRKESLKKGQCSNAIIKQGEEEDNGHFGN